MTGRRRTAVLVVATAFAGVVAGCSSGGGAHRSGPPTAPAQSTAPPRSSAVPGRTSATRPRPAAKRPSKTHAAAGSAAQRVFDAMTEPQRVGQLLMVDCPSTGVSDATSAAITRYDVGSVILDGTSEAGLSAAAQVTSQLRGLAPRGVGLFVSTDQEGGIVQRLQGPGFSTIPDANVQGDMSPSSLRSSAEQWGRELKRAGVNVNLAPVLDTVPSGFGSNPPIGDLQRQYGSTPAAVRAHGLAYAQGMADAGIDATAKHFPGLGRTRANTDVSGDVTDSTTTRRDAYLEPFAAAVKDGVPFVMISTASYSRIDPGNPAAFSKNIVTGMLRHDLGFRGVIVSDDIGAARQVSDLSPGERAVAFVVAGGDLVLTVDAGQAQEMTSALLAKAESDPSFKDQIDTAALVVLRAKQARGLLG